MIKKCSKEKDLVKKFGKKATRTPHAGVRTFTWKRVGFGCDEKGDVKKKGGGGACVGKGEGTMIKARRLPEWSQGRSRARRKPRHRNDRRSRDVGPPCGHVTGERLLERCYR